MKLWRRATGAIKDKLSLIISTNEKFTAAIIKATSHNDGSIDSDNVHFIHSYINNNPSSFKPILRAISIRVKRTRNWTVALKCLMLLHSLFLAGNTAVDSIGRLPFDLSDFGKRKSRFSKTGRFNIFIRAYFLFLDERSILFFNDDDDQDQIIVKMQRIFDSLMRIKPIGETPLVIEAMELVIREILMIYDFLSEVYGKSETAKYLSEGEELFKYFEFCRDSGVITARKISDFSTSGN